MRALIEWIYYNIYDIMPKPLLVDLNIFKMPPKERLSESVENEISIATDFIQKLEKLEYGKERKNDKKYEKLCVDIINFLFGTEFTRTLLLLYQESDYLLSILEHYLISISK